MKKYTYSRTNEGETFTAVEFDSFDEAIKAVKRGIYERKLKEAVEREIYERKLKEKEESTLDPTLKETSDNTGAVK